MSQLLKLSRSMRGWLSARPRALTTAILLMALVLFGGTGAAAWFAYDLTAGLPSKS